MIIDSGWSPETTQDRSRSISNLLDLDFLNATQLPAMRPSTSGGMLMASLLDLNTGLPSAWRTGSPEHVLTVAYTLSVSDPSYVRDHRPVPILDPLKHFAFGAAQRKGFDNIDAAKAHIDRYVSAVSQLIEAHHIKIVVRSMGGSIEITENDCRLFIRNLTECKRRLSDLLRQGLFNLVKNNPGTAFVLAAPNNEGQKIQPESEVEFPLFSEPNVLVVGSIEANGDLTSYSGWHPEIVRLATFGSVFTPGNGRQISTGNSIAAPRAAAELGKFMRAFSHSVSAGQMIDEFLRSRTEQLSRLAGKVRDERALRQFEGVCVQDLAVR